MRILLSNDDGINAVGLRELHRALTTAGHTVLTVAPMNEQSAVSSHLTIRGTMRYTRIANGFFNGISLDGSPADCVMAALYHFYTDENQPDLVVSGINAGHNVGLDVLYSGTIAAAREGTIAGIPSIAVSRWLQGGDMDDPSGVADLAASIISSMPWASIPAHCTWNLNFPPYPVCKMKATRLCRLSGAQWDIGFTEATAPDGSTGIRLTNVPFPYERIAGREDTDVDLLCQGYITLTPLTLDFTDRQALIQVKNAYSSTSHR